MRFNTGFFSYLIQMQTMIDKANLLPDLAFIYLKSSATSAYQR